MYCLIQTVPLWSLMFRTNASVTCRGDQYFVLEYLCTQNLIKRTWYPLLVKRGDECEMQNNFGDGAQNTWNRLVLHYRNTLQAQVASISSFEKLKLGFRLTVKMKRTVAVSSLVCLLHYLPYFFTYKPSDFFSFRPKILGNFSRRTGFGLQPRVLHFKNIQLLNYFTPRLVVKLAMKQK